MTLAEMIESAQTRFPHNGKFELKPEQVINEVVRIKNVPDARGVYIIFSSDDADRPLYIGKAGTLETNGSWKKQGLRERMTKKQKGEYRKKFFLRVIDKKGLKGLTFLWFITHDEKSKIIPALFEMELLQAHYDQFGCLPELNECA